MNGFSHIRRNGWTKARYAAVLLMAPSLLHIGTASAQQGCDFSEVPVRKINANAFYRQDDPTRSEVDEAAAQKNSLANKGIIRFLKYISQKSDQYYNSSNVKSKTCLDNVLYKWAYLGGLTKNADNAQSKYMRQWAISTIAIVRLKAGPLKDRRKDAVVTRWMSRLANLTYDYHAYRKGPRNNHYYWATLGIGATGLAIGDRTLLNKARIMDDTALSDIQPNGTLKAEMARGKRAAHYHATAAQPLAVFDLFERKCLGHGGKPDPRLERLMRVVREVLVAPDKIRLTNMPQQMALPKQPWLNLWDAVNAGTIASPNAGFEQRLGGDMRSLSTLLRTRCAIRTAG